PVEHEHLGVQGELPGARRFQRVAAHHRLPEYRPYLIDLDPGFEQWDPVLLVRRVDNRHIGRRKRIGEYAHLQPALAQLLQELHTGIPGHQIGGHNEQLGPRLFDPLGQPVAQQASRLVAVFDLVFLRAVVDDFRTHPYPGRVGGKQRAQRFAAGQPAHIVLVVHRDVVLRQRIAIVGQRLLRRLAAEQRLDRNRQRTVPEVIEARRHVLDDAAGGDDVIVAEVEVASFLKVRIADIASADDADLVVDDEKLVVHPTVQPDPIAQQLDVVQKLQKLHLAPVHRRVEYAQLDIRVRSKRRQLDRASARSLVVEQYTHSHAAIGGLQQRFLDE